MSTSSRQIASVRKLTPLQFFAVFFLLSLFIVWGLSSFVIYSGNQQADATLFVNSQTFPVFTT